ncbi:MAG: ribonuclease P [Candidatus Bathyarchaeota archaeon]
MARVKRYFVVRRENKRIALERISILFKIAIKTMDTEPKLVQRYVDLARRIGMRYKVRMPKEFRRMICRHCKGFVLPGKNCIVRLRQEREPHIVITCLRCGKCMREPLKKRFFNKGKSH